MTLLRALFPMSGHLAGCERGIDLWIAEGAAARRAVGPEAMAGLLSHDERARAARLVSDLPREQFVTARAVLRIILGSYVDCPPSDVEFVYGSYGKPAVVEASRHPPLAFNLSHSDDVTVVAVGRGAPLGIDVERLRTARNTGALAGLCLSPQEHRRHQSLSHPDRPVALLRAWVAKEALLKALGVGLHWSMTDLEIARDEQNPGVRRVTYHGRSESWQIEEFCPADDYLACLATRSDRPRPIRCITHGHPPRMLERGWNRTCRLLLEGAPSSKSKLNGSEVTHS